MIHYIMLWSRNLSLLLSSSMQDQVFEKICSEDNYAVSSLMIGAFSEGCCYYWNIFPVKFPASTIWTVDIDIILELQVAIFVVLAMTLRRKPEVLISLMPIIKENPKYQGQDKLPVTIWVIAQVKLENTIHWMDVVFCCFVWVVLNQDSTVLS